jgi:hypothetical protein
MYWLVIFVPSIAPKEVTVYSSVEVLVTLSICCVGCWGGGGGNRTHPYCKTVVNSTSSHCKNRLELCKNKEYCHIGINDFLPII